MVFDVHRASVFAEGRGTKKESEVVVSEERSAETQNPKQIGVGREADRELRRMRNTNRGEGQK